MSAQANKQAVEAAYAAAASGDAAGFLGALAEDITVHEPPFLPFGGTHRGVEEVVAMMRAAAATVAPEELTVESLVAEDDLVSANLTIGLRNGREVLVNETWRMRDGKAAELRVFWFDPSAVE